MLTISHLSVAVAEKPILHDISLQFEQGKHYVLLGKNGSGKSSLAMTIMGSPKYTITDGDILLDGESIREWEPSRRAKSGIFLAFQHLPEIKGVKLFEFLRTVYDARFETSTSFLQFKKIIEPLFQEFSLEKDFLWRDLYVGFSGGERRKLELLQVKLLQPRFVFLDEIDSGLDVDAVKFVADFLAQLQHTEISLIIITHLFSLLEQLHLSEVVVLRHGHVVLQGGSEILDQVRTDGYENL